jgi:hypothetical protein
MYFCLPLRERDVDGGREGGRVGGREGRNLCDVCV